MKNIFFIILFFFVSNFLLQAQADSIIGSKFIEKLFQHEYSDAESFFDPSVKSKLNKKVLEQVVTSLETSIGKYKMLSLLIKESTGARLLRCFASTRHSAFR